MADDALADITAYAVRAGVDPRLVQGAGGNFSAKVDDVVWVKASGTRLAEAKTRPIFVPLHLGPVREAVLVTEALLPYVVAESAPEGLRPSIETAFHALLPHRFVAHLHPTGAIALGLDPESADRFRELCGDLPTVEVAYAKPGIELARAIDAELASIDPDVALVGLLRNHGLVVAAPTLAELEEIVARVQQGTETFPPPTFVDAGVPGTVDGFEALAPAGSLTPEAVAVLDHGPLTPDGAVFLGARPFVPAAEAGASTACVVLPDGSVEILATMGPDEREIAASMVDIARLVPAGRRVRALTEPEIRELIDWDAEKWRQGMRR